MLDVAVSSRAPANTALTTAQWTNARAALLDRLANIPASGGLSASVGVSVQRGRVHLPVTGVSEASVSVIISLVNLNRSFMTMQSRTAVTTGHLSAPDALEFSGTQGASIDWQVITFS